MEKFQSSSQHSTQPLSAAEPRRTLLRRIQGAAWYSHIHLSNVLSRTWKINKSHIDKVRAAANGYRLVFECILRSHCYNLSLLAVKKKENKINNIILCFFRVLRRTAVCLEGKIEAHLWFLSILSCSDVTYSSNIKDIHFIILINPIQIKSMLINFEGDGRAWSWVLRENMKRMLK